MKQSQLSRFIRHNLPKDEEAANAQVLIRAGFVDKIMAGVYAYLPLGLRVLQNIENIVRKHMNALGAQEVLMPALTPKENWEKTDRWATFDALFKIVSRDKREYALGATHEEIVVPLAQKAIFSYKDLPTALYQIQTKFRDEPRAKSGLLRGREFLMKDLYSFHADEADLDAYYDQVTEAYERIFKEIGLDAHLTEASGGTFSKLSHEFQVFHENGEDQIVYCPACGLAQNTEISDRKEGDACSSCQGQVQIVSGIEAGNIFKLYRKYSDPFSLSYTDAQGASLPVQMGCYGIGISRLMGVLAEVFHDEKGLMWPASVAPFDVHLIILEGAGKDEGLRERAQKAYEAMREEGIEVLFDDRSDMSAGEKFAEADLIGIPIRVVVSQKTGDKFGIKRRSEPEEQLVDFSEIKKYCSRITL